VVIGATGGSGTRVVALVLRRAGLFLGTELNASEDAWRFGEFSDRWINVYLGHREGQLPENVEQAMLGDLAALLNDHCRGLEDGARWGWKEPRSIYLLELFHRRLPALRFLHVVRDGRDMALAENQNQLLRHGSAAPIPDDAPPAVRSMALWSWINLRAARYGEAQLGDSYLRIRFEDLCARPVAVAGKVFSFAGLDADAGLARDEVAPPATLGRWRATDPALVAELERAGGDALAMFGY
jgi:Sulfotransferase family